MDFQKDVYIDPNYLDIAWLEQPSLMAKYAKLAADAKHAYDVAQEELSLVKAELDSDIRSNPEEYDLPGKVTETVVANTILQQPQYKKASKRVVDTRYELEIARAAVQALEHKRQALENLVKLFASQYFAGPSVAHMLDQEWEKHQLQKKSNEKVKINRRK